MSKPHQATPDDWAQQEDWANRSAFSDSSCIIELRDRIEALEAGQQPPQDKLDRLIAIDRDDSTEAAAQQPPLFSAEEAARIVAPNSSAGSLVGRVAKAIYDAPNTHEGWSSEARAAILEVAAALIDWWDSDEVARTGWEAAKWLEQEANR